MPAPTVVYTLSTVTNGAAAMASTVISVPAGYGAKPTGAGADGPMPSGSGADPSGQTMMGPQLSPEQLAEDRSYEVYWSVGMNIALCTFFFVCRMASRYMTRVKPRPSDWILLGGVICSFALGGVSLMPSGC